MKCRKSIEGGLRVHQLAVVCEVAIWLAAERVARHLLLLLVGWKSTSYYALFPAGKVVVMREHWIEQHGEEKQGRVHCTGEGVSWIIWLCILSQRVEKQMKESGSSNKGNIAVVHPKLTPKLSYTSWGSKVSIIDLFILFLLRNTRKKLLFLWKKNMTKIFMAKTGSNEVSLLLHEILKLEHRIMTRKIFAVTNHCIDDQLRTE